MQLSPARDSDSIDVIANNVRSDFEKFALGGSQKVTSNDLCQSFLPLCLVFAMPIALLVKILGLLVYCEKEFPVSSGYYNTRVTF